MQSVSKASYCHMVGHLANKELEKIWTEAVMLILRYYAVTCLEGLVIVKKKTLRDNWSPGQYLNWGDFKNTAL
jgi:hypothetical protein